MPRLARLLSSGSVAACMLLCGCESDDDRRDAAGPCPSSVQPWEDVIDDLGAEYLGTVHDGGDDVACRYDGSRFALELALDPDSQCVAESFCAVGPFDCGLSGPLELDGDPVGELAGSVYVIEGKSPGLVVRLRVAELSDAGSERGMLAELQGAMYSKDLGGVGSSLSWTFRHGTDEPTWEACLLTIDEIRR